MGRPSSWDAPLQAWASQQTQPFTMRQAIIGAGMLVNTDGPTRTQQSAIRRALIRLGYRPSHSRGHGPRGSTLWWDSPNPPTEAPQPLQARAQQIIEAREALDAAAATLTQALEEWEASLVARQDPPQPVDTDALFRAGRQEGRQAREIEIVALIEERLSKVSRGGLAHLQLRSLKNTIQGIDA